MNILQLNLSNKRQVRDFLALPFSIQAAAFFYLFECKDNLPTADFASRSMRSTPTCAAQRVTPLSPTRQKPPPFLTRAF